MSVLFWITGKGVNLVADGRQGGQGIKPLCPYNQPLLPTKEG